MKISGMYEQSTVRRRRSYQFDVVWNIIYFLCCKDVIGCNGSPRVTATINIAYRPLERDLKGPPKRHRDPGKGTLKEQVGFLVSRSLTLASAPL